MRVLITGGSGFIAKALITRLLREEFKVSALTRNKAGCLPPRPGALDIYEADIADAPALQKLVMPDKVDVVVHLAASLDYFGDRRKLFSVNAGGTANLLDWTLKNGVRKLVFISSIEAMGAVQEDEIPADEKSTPAPLSTYGESKLEAERLVEKFSREKIILRLGNVYGPPSPAFIVPLADAILKRGRLLKLLPYYGERRIHPVFIYDVVDAITKTLKPDAPGGIYIIAGEKHVTAAEFFKAVAGNMGASLDIDGIKPGYAARLALRFYSGLCRMQKRADLLAYFTAGSGGRIHRAYSIEKAARELGYVPQVGLEDGIHRTIDWAKKEGMLPK